MIGQTDGLPLADELDIDIQVLAFFGGPGEGDLSTVRRKLGRDLTPGQARQGNGPPYSCRRRSRRRGDAGGREPARNERQGSDAEYGRDDQGALRPSGTEILGRPSIRRFHRSDKTVPSLGESLNEARIGRGIIEGGADFANGGRDAVLKIDERLVRPETLLELVSRDDFAGPLQQGAEDLKGLLLEADLDAALAQLAAEDVELKDSESHDARPLRSHYG